MIKKISVGLALLLSGLSANALADSSPCSATVPSFNGGFTLGISGLYLRPTSDNLDYAVVYPINANGDALSGHVKSAEPDYDWGYRVSAGYLFPCTGNDLTLTYSNFNHHTVNRADVPSDSILVGTVTPVFFQAGDNASAAIAANARYNYQTLDVDFGQHLNLGCNTHIKFIGGVRFADLDSTFKADYNTVTEEQSTVVESVATRQHSEFKGAGPRFGTNLEYNLGNGFGIVGQATASLLVGNISTNFDERDIELTGDDVTSDVAVGFHQRHTARVVPNLTGKLGVNYNFEFCNPSRTKMTVEAGYQVDHYFNVNEHQKLLDAFGAGKQVTDTSFNGPYVGLQVKL